LPRMEQSPEPRKVVQRRCGAAAIPRTGCGMATTSAKCSAMGGLKPCRTASCG
jgi:hypothetical protein